MIHEKIFLKEHFKNITTNASFTTYCPDNYSEFSTNRRRKAVIVIPGGGYSMVSEREAEPIALQFIKEDIASFVLDYTVGDFEFPTPIDEVFATILYIRKNAKKYHINPNKISLIGFSAGGHLASSSAMMWNDEYFKILFNTTNDKLKINGLLLGYPVITMDEKNSHLGTVELRTHKNEELKEKFSVEKHITNDFPKTFIWLTASDPLVPAYNSLTLAQELVNHNIMVELHMYPTGPHGLALANDNTTIMDKTPTDYPDVHTWIEHAIYFIKNRI